MRIIRPFPFSHLSISRVTDKIKLYIPGIVKLKKGIVPVLHVIN